MVTDAGQRRRFAVTEVASVETSTAPTLRIFGQAAARLDLTTCEGPRTRSGGSTTAGSSTTRGWRGVEAASPVARRLPNQSVITWSGGFPASAA